MIELYEHNGQGYNPFIIRGGWQVAQLNHLDEQDLDGIVKVDMHLQTDEVFILLRGMAVLVVATAHGPENLQFECMKMRPGITYNIPVNTWHNIAMDREASVLIVERSNTHLGDYVYRSLSTGQQHELRRAIKSALRA